VAVELRRKLNKLKWDDAKEPSEFFEKIASIEIFSNKLTTDKITESELCSQVFCAAPKRHMAALQLVKNDKGANLTVDDLEEKMAEAWRLEHIADDDSDDSSDDDSDDEKEGTEKVLTTQEQSQGNGGKKFEGICYKCGKGGHKAYQCHGGRGFAGGRGGGRGHGGRRFNGLCHNCGKAGHRKADCWEDEANASKRPSNWTSSKTNEQAMATATSSTEFMCMTVNQMRFPDTLRLLEDPNIMIADTGATCDSTPHEFGIRKTREAIFIWNMCQAMRWICLFLLLTRLILAGRRALASCRNIIKIMQRVKTVKMMTCL